MSYLNYDSNVKIRAMAPNNNHSHKTEQNEKKEENYSGFWRFKLYCVVRMHTTNANNWNVKPKKKKNAQITEDSTLEEEMKKRTQITGELYVISGLRSYNFHYHSVSICVLSTCSR